MASSAVLEIQSEVLLSKKTPTKRKTNLALDAQRSEDNATFEEKKKNSFDSANTPNIPELPAVISQRSKLAQGADRWWFIADLILLFPAAAGSESSAAAPRRAAAGVSGRTDAER